MQIVSFHLLYKKLSKPASAKFNAEELVTKRETAKGVIAQAIRNTLTSNNILVENVFITDFKFSESFAEQIEQKVVAFQKFLTEENNLRAVRVIANQNVVQAEAAARANIAKASGEAQAIELITGQLRIKSRISTMAGHKQMEWSVTVCLWNWRSSILPASITTSSNNKPNESSTLELKAKLADRTTRTETH